MKNAKKLIVAVMLVASSLASASVTRSKYPLPAPIPTSCPSDVLCW